MFAGEDAADFHAELQNLARYLQRRFGVARLALVEQDGRVQVAVPGVKQVGDWVSSPLGYVANPRERLHEARSGDGAVHEQIVGRETSERAQDAFASRPQLLALNGVCGGAHFDGVVQIAHLFDRRDFLFDRLGEPVHFDEQNRARALRVSGADGGFGGADAQVVHHLDGGGDDSRADDAGDGGAGVIQLVEHRQQRLDRLRLAQQANGYLGHDRQRPLRPDDDAAQIEARAFSLQAADPLDAAVGVNDLHAQDVVGGDAVCEAVRPAGVFRNIAADSAGALAGRVGREVKPMLGDDFGQPQVDDARLDDGDAVFDVDVENAGHARERENQPAVFGDRAAAQPRPRAARHDGQPEIGGDADASRRLVRPVRQRHDGGQSAVDRTVVFERDKVFGLVDDVLVAHRRLKPLNDRSHIHKSRAPPVIRVA